MWKHGPCTVLVSVWVDGSGFGCVEAGTLYSPCEWVDGSGCVEAWTLYSPCECLGLGLGVWKQGPCTVLVFGWMGLGLGVWK